MQVQSLFQPENRANARIDFYGKPGKDIYYDSITLSEIKNYQLFDPYQYSAHLINNTPNNKAFTCADANIPICTAFDDQGKVVAWPIVIQPYTSRIILARDMRWMSNAPLAIAPTLTLTASSTVAVYNSSTSIAWSSTDTTSCTTPW